MPFVIPRMKTNSPYHELLWVQLTKTVWKCRNPIELFVNNRGLKGSFYYAKAFGEDSDESLATDGVHFLASSTKFVTTVAVMQCVERGLLSLDVDISEILPEWRNPQILTGFDEQDTPTFQAATKAITLR
jgi:CubicO group peptidase (beta-lactamase class C family)